MRCRSRPSTAALAAVTAEPELPSLGLLALAATAVLPRRYIERAGAG